MRTSVPSMSMTYFFLVEFFIMHVIAVFWSEMMNVYIHNFFMTCYDVHASYAYITFAQGFYLISIKLCMYVRE